MEDSTLSALGLDALSQGIRFLFEQATIALGRRRERKDEERTASEPAPLAGELEPLVADEPTLHSRHKQIETLIDALRDYAEGSRAIAIDPELLKNTAALREHLEAIYGQRFTIVGEARPESGPLTIQEIKIKRVGVGAEAIAIEADEILEGKVQTKVEIEDIEGTFKGQKFGRIGR